MTFPELARPDMIRPRPEDEKAANEAHSVDAPIACGFHVVYHWRRATDARRSDNEV